MHTARDRLQSQSMGVTLSAIFSLLFALGAVAESTDILPQNALPNAPVELARTLTATHGAFADPAVSLPRLTWVLPEQAEQAWLKVKHLASPAAQAAAIRRGGIEQLACRNLVDFKDVARRTGADFLFRDAFRGRSWARPALARVLVRSLERFRQEYPESALSIGDIAQPGCGQVAYGTLVQQWGTGEAADAAAPDHQHLRQQIRRVLGEALVVEHAVSGDFPLESDRFSAPSTPILIERRVLGHSGLDAANTSSPTSATAAAATPTLLRTATRRFARDPLPNKPKRAQRQVAAMLKLVRRLLEEGELVRHELARSWDPVAGLERTAMVQHRVDRERGRQVLVVATRPMLGRLDLSQVAELRISAWRPGKPESFRGETRWRPLRNAAGEITGWDRWHMLAEAGHSSHDGGRDADISFVTTTNQGLHKVRLKPMDVAATWRWLQIVDETARDLGTPVEQILVGKKVRAWLARKLPRELKESALWRTTVQVVPGHDAHHHLRLAAPTASDDAQALADLRGEPAHTASR